MTSGRSTSRAKKSVPLSVMLGTLLVPLSAYAASALLDGGDVSAIAAEPSPPMESAVTGPTTIAADLGTACGEAGLAMVAAETAGSINELQQAALDALRGICAEQGIPLPAPEPELGVTAVTQPSPPPSAPAGEQVVVATDDEDDHGRHGGDDDGDDDGRHWGDDEDDDDHGRHGEDHD